MTKSKTTKKKTNYVSLDTNHVAALPMESTGSDQLHFDEERFEQGLAMALSAFDINSDVEEDNVQLAFIRLNIAKGMCNTFRFGGKREETQLGHAVSNLAKAERESDGTEISEQVLERALKRLESAEKKINIFKKIMNIAEERMFKSEMQELIPVMPEWYASKISETFEPWIAKSDYKKAQDRKKQTYGKVLAQEKLAKYKDQLED
jgi:hypothetical protein